MFNRIKEMFCRHTWRPLRTEYRYREYETGRWVVVKRCQCRKCGKLAYNHFVDKTIR